MFYTDPAPATPVLKFGQMDKLTSKVAWGPLVEKAWAKVIGSYATFVSD